ncbi:DUF427 domain-containing protein [Prosthecomicrobium sp. N25]|uniref:DUF427 domain-containing protein n=1 Tax=Prosthecomicrobium sp. N25 TaxID=3129254 RepID=UPI0030782311
MKNLASAGPEPGPGCGLKAAGGRVLARLGDRIIATSDQALVMTDGLGGADIFIPADDLHIAGVAPGRRALLMEGIGVGFTLDVRVGEEQYPDVAWTVPCPGPEVAEILGHVAFDPAQVDITVLSRAA